MADDTQEAYVIKPDYSHKSLEQLRKDTQRLQASHIKPKGGGKIPPTTSQPKKP